MTSQRLWEFSVSYKEKKKKKILHLPLGTFKVVRFHDFYIYFFFFFDNFLLSSKSERHFFFSLSMRDQASLSLEGLNQAQP